jgi:hypothetical protein
MTTFKDRIFPDTRMNRGDTLISFLGAFHLDMQTDGNLVLYRPAMIPLWASGTVGNGDFARMQSDGNLVVYDLAGRPVFASNTAGNPGAFIICQDDGNLVIYRGGQVPHPSTAIWSTNTCAGCGD